MKSKAEVKDIFNCSVERAFKAPILGDATKFLDGYLFQPGVTGFEEDETWGTPNGIRYPVTEGNLFVKKGRLFTDKILERNENKYWKWTVYDFLTSALFFANKGIGEWTVVEIDKGRIEVTYKYTYYSKNSLLQPVNWLFVHIQLKGMMKRAMAGIKKQAESEDEFIYEGRK